MVYVESIEKGTEFLIPRTVIAWDYFPAFFSLTNTVTRETFLFSLRRPITMTAIPEGDYLRMKVLLVVGEVLPGQYEYRLDDGRESGLLQVGAPANETKAYDPNIEIQEYDTTAGE